MGKFINVCYKLIFFCSSRHFFLKYSFVYMIALFFSLTSCSPALTSSEEDSIYPQRHLQTPDTIQLSHYGNTLTFDKNSIEFQDIWNLLLENWWIDAKGDEMKDPVYTMGSFAKDRDFSQFPGLIYLQYDTPIKFRYLTGSYVEIDSLLFFPLGSDDSDDTDYYAWGKSQDYTGTLYYYRCSQELVELIQDMLNN